MNAHTPTPWAATIWGTPYSGLMYTMIGKPDSKGWAKFQCVSALQRIREWKVSDMRPVNDAARAALARSQP